MQTLKRIASITQKRIPIFKIEKSGLFVHNPSSKAGGFIESRQREIGEVFRGVLKFYTVFI